MRRSTIQRGVVNDSGGSTHLVPERYDRHTDVAAIPGAGRCMRGQRTMKIPQTTRDVLRRTVVSVSRWVTPCTPRHNLLCGILLFDMPKDQELNTRTGESQLTEIRSLCVYCGSWSGRDPELEDFARAFGSACAARGIELIYGGGGIGLMGTVAGAALAGAGRVVGIIPRSLMESESPFADVTELVIVDSMHRRKHEMFRRADGFVSLPGGFGTLDETIEVITWRQLGFHDKPIVLANYRGYWDPLLSLFDHIVAGGFASRDSQGLYAVADTVDAVFQQLTPSAAPRLRASA